MRVPGELHVVRGELLAAVPLDALAQLDDPMPSVVGHRVALGERRYQLLGFPVLVFVEPVVDRAEDVGLVVPEP